ncbi:MAG: hypothetical protein WCF96_01885 [Eubacteriales bacterium]
MIDHKIKEGLSKIFTREVSYSDIGTSMSSDVLDFLISTPTLITIIVDSTHKFLEGLIPNEFVTVGRYIELSHEKPTLVGETISLVLTVEKVDGDKVFLDINIHDANGLICKGKYLRLIVNKEKLIATAYARSTQDFKK